MSPLTIYDDGPLFPALPGPIITRDQLRDEEFENPERFGPEYAAQWAAVLNAYLKPEHVARCFGPWRGEPLTMQSAGRHNTVYVAHGDPSRSGANFAFVVAHREDDDDGPYPHVIVDLIRVWRPKDFPNHEINYMTVENEIFDILNAFRLEEISFDQYNSAGIIDRLRALAHDLCSWPTNIYERTATTSDNWREAENFKTALAKDLFHSSFHPLADEELRFLQWDGYRKVAPPPTGPCTTSDVADCFFAVVDRLLGEYFAPGRQLGATRLQGGYPGGLPISSEDQTVFDQLGASASFNPNRVQRPPQLGRDPREVYRYYGRRSPRRLGF